MPARFVCDEVVEAVVRAVLVRPADAAVGDERVDGAAPAAAAATAASTCARSRMSQGPASARQAVGDLLEPLELEVRAALSVAPSAASRSAIALPIPTPPPVTTTCLPSKSLHVRSPFGTKTLFA